MSVYKHWVQNLDGPEAPYASLSLGTETVNHSSVYPSDEFTFSLIIASATGLRNCRS